MCHLVFRLWLSCHLHDPFLANRFDFSGQLILFVQCFYIISTADAQSIYQHIGDCTTAGALRQELLDMRPQRM